MSKNPKNVAGEQITNKNDVKEVVAETVQQLVTTSQEKPATDSTANKTTEAPKLPEYDSEHVKTLNVSQTVRYLTAQGFTRGQIVKAFPQIKGRTILYQHVRNILVTPIKTAG